MSGIKVIVFALLMLFSAAGPILAANPLFDFDGLWEGEIKGFNLPQSFTQSKYDFPLQLLIEGDTVSVRYQKDGQWKLLKQDKFKMQKQLANAIIFAFDSGKTPNPWVESWTFAVTRRDESTLLVYWYRTLNCYEMTPDKENARMAFGGTGELKRVK